MPKKTTWVMADTLPPLVQKMLVRFECASGFRGDDYKIVHYLDDTVFVALSGMLDLYMLARLVVHSPDISFEVEVPAKGYWTLRMFGSDWQIEHGPKRKLPWIEKEIYDDVFYIGSVRVETQIERRLDESP